MALMFCKAVKKYQESLSKLLNNEKNSGKKDKLCTWSYVASRIVTLLQNYPTGLTESVLLTELLTAISLPYKIKEDCFGSVQSNKHEKGRQTSISELCETKDVDLSCHLECYVQLESRYNFEGTTRIVCLVDKLCDGDEYDKSSPVMDMYLHQKAECMEHYIFKYPLLMTNLRIRKVEECGRYRLLPTEYFMPVLHSDTDNDFITSTFGTLDGILDEDSIPHFTRNVIATVTEIGELETICSPFFDTAEKLVLGLIDSNHVPISFILWDEAIAFARLISVGDSFGIKDPFLVNDEGDVHLEYAPATIFFFIRSKLVPEKILSQAQPNHMMHIRKTSHGKLDFELYPFQVVSSDISKDCINISLFGVVKSVSHKEPFWFSTTEGAKFIMEVYDNHGALQIEVYDNCMNLHEQIYVGHIVLLENITTDEHSCCTLRTWKSSRLSILSALKGYVASPCLYNVASGHQITGNGSYFIIGRISGFQPLNGEYIKKVHVLCLKTVKKSKERKLLCLHCTSKSLVEFNAGGHLNAKNMSTYWKWRYSIRISVELQDIDCTTLFDATEQVCEELIKLSAEEFSKRTDDERTSMLLGSIGKTYVLSVTRVGDTIRIDSFEFAPDSFLENLKLTDNVNINGKGVFVNELN